MPRLTQKKRRRAASTSCPPNRRPPKPKAQRLIVTPSKEETASIHSHTADDGNRVDSPTKLAPPQHEEPTKPTRKSARLIDAAKDKEKAEIREWANENMNLLPSPNQQTRQKRDESNTPCESNSVERARIARIIMDCSELEYVPCFVYGRDRETKYPAHFLCSRCKKADDEETPGSSRVINRLAEGGRYRCTANHTNWYRPTHLNDKSKHLPEAPPSSLFCVPIEDQPVAPPPPPPLSSSQNHAERNRTRITRRYHVCRTGR